MTKTHILVDLQSFRHLLAPTFNNDRHALCEEPPSIMEFKVRYKLCKLSEIVNRNSYKIIGRKNPIVSLKYPLLLSR